MSENNAVETPKVVIPPNAKQPQDHKKPKKSAAQLEAEGSDIPLEYAGQTYIIERAALDDVELLELVGDLADGDAMLLPKIVRKVLGAAQWKKFKDANRDDAGRIPSERLQELFTIVDDAAGKSSASPTS